MQQSIAASNRPPLPAPWVVLPDLRVGVAAQVANVPEVAGVVKVSLGRIQVLQLARLGLGLYRAGMPCAMSYAKPGRAMEGDGGRAWW
jgi:hypothetical protein